MTSIIYNSIRSAALDAISLSDPSRVIDVTAKQVDSLSKSMADQINSQRLKYPPAMTCVDLEQYIVDIVIETTVQGTSFLELHLADPFWVLLQRDQNGACFFDVDTDGFLWPPIEVAFPEGQTDQVWVICQLRPSTDASDANVIVTFEDKIVAEMREHDNTTDPSLATSRSAETRAEFIKRAVKTAVPSIKFVSLLSIGSPTAFTAADLAADELPPPTSTKPPNKRSNHMKAPKVADKHRATSTTVGPTGNAVIIDGTTAISIASGTTGGVKQPNPNLADIFAVQSPFST